MAQISNENPLEMDQLTASENNHHLKKKPKGIFLKDVSPILWSREERERERESDLSDCNKIFAHRTHTNFLNEAFEFAFPISIFLSIFIYFYSLIYLSIHFFNKTGKANKGECQILSHMLSAVSQGKVL